MDIDIDFYNRDTALAHLEHRLASRTNNDTLVKHNTGIYFQDIPYNPFNNLSTIDYKEAEERGYFKIDFLNVHVYEHVRDETHLVNLTLQQPNWERFNNDQSFFEQLVHVHDHWYSLKRMPEKVDSVEKLAMFLAILRPGKKHLISNPWTEVEKTIWIPDETQYFFKKSHSVAYAHLVVIHMNILEEIELLIDRD
jgi:hypothetical protein